ncbi:MAG: hypothetical protein AB7O80_24285, partial [Acetobacteraceae bacterium]
VPASTVNTEVSEAPTPTQPRFADGTDIAPAAARTELPEPVATPATAAATPEPVSTVNTQVSEAPTPTRPRFTDRTEIAPAAARAELPEPVATPPTASPASDPLLTRGHTYLASGDVVSARLMYEHAARSGSAAAAMAAGMTYDARFLTELGIRGMVADPQAAATWYKRAAELGDDRAAPLLAGLRTQP